MAPVLLLLVTAVAVAAGENHSLEDTVVYLQQSLQPARPTRWGADWMRRGACQAMVFDLHNRQRLEERTIGGVPPFQMNLGWTTDSCQRLADPPTYKMRSGTFWAHWGCSLTLFESESCSGTSNRVTFGAGNSYFVVKSRVHPGNDEGRFFKSARCYCSGVAGLSMRLENNASEEVSDIAEQETTEETAEEAAEERGNAEVEEMDEEAAADEEGGLQEARGEQVEELSEEMISNSSSLSGDFRGSRACLWHHYSGSQFHGNDFSIFFNIRRSTSPFDRRRARRNLCLKRFPSSPDRFSFYAIVEKGCELHTHSSEGCQGRSARAIDNSNVPDREAGTSRLLSPFWDGRYTKSISCWCNGRPVSR